MKFYNLSRFYILNLLSWSSWIAHIVYPLFLLFLFNIFPHTQMCETGLASCSDKVIFYPFLYFFYYYHLVLLLLILAGIEFILRLFKIIRTYNEVNKKSKLTSFLYWFGIILIPLFAYCLYQIAILIDRAIFTD